ncbi:MAG: hypothetical protein RL077_1150 [Verrucomicrobiota bacterium]
MKRYHRVFLLALGVLCSRAHAELSVAATGGFSSLQLRPAEKTRTVPRYDWTLGWRFTPWLSFEASVFTAGSPGGEALPSAPKSVYAIGFVSAPGGPPLNPDVFVPTDLARTVRGSSAGPVFSWPVAPHLRIFSRQHLARTAVDERGYLTYYRRGNPPVASKTITLNDWGYQGGLGLAWTLPRFERWKVHAEWLYTTTKNVRMNSLLASVHVDFDRPAPQPTTPLSVAVAAGATALHWRTGERSSVVALREARLTWKLNPWVALDLSAFQSGIASNTRVRTYRYQNFHFANATPVVTPIDPGAPVPPPFITVPPLVLLPLPLPTPILPAIVTSNVPWTLRRQIDGFALGPCFTLPLTATLSLRTRQQIAHATEHEWGRLLAEKSGRDVSTVAHRGWSYQPTAGITWSPPKIPHCEFAVDTLFTNTATARMTSTPAHASFLF